MKDYEFNGYKSNNIELKDDEISMYEILEIVIKNKTIIITTFITVCIISLFVALLIRRTTPKYYVKELTINKNTYSLTGVNRLYPEHIFLLDSTINKIYEISDLQKLYKSKVKTKKIKIDEHTEIERKRAFLKKIIVLKNQNNIYMAEVKILKNKKLSKDIMDKFIGILLEQDNLEEIITHQNLKVKKKLYLLNQKIELLTKQYENQLIRKNTNEKNKVFEYTNPFLELKLNEISTMQNMLLGKIIKFDKIDDTKRVKIITDMYVMENDNNTIMIIIGGAFLGAILGIILAFLKNFITEFKLR